MKKLFLSFTAALTGIADGSVTEADLRTGLFLIGGVREHVLVTNLADNPGENAWSGVPRKIHAKLIDALHLAESEQRVGWVRPSARVRRDSFTVLNEVFSSHDLPMLGLPGERFSYQVLSESIASARLSLQPVY